jgi:uncharacterized protein YndB with AHSA1/START domain
MLGFILVITYFGAALIAAAIILQPNWFVIRRSAVIEAPPHRVFEHINDLHNWEAWSHWAQLDPHAQTQHAGPPAGSGAAFEWSGNRQVGAGRITIVDSRPDECVDLKLEMERPYAATSDVSFTLEPEEGAPQNQATIVTLTMAGRNTLLSKALNVVTKRDKMIGGQIEKSLANLSTIFAK